MEERGYLERMEFTQIIIKDNIYNEFRINNDIIIQSSFTMRTELNAMESEASLERRMNLQLEM